MDIIYRYDAYAKIVPRLLNEPDDAIRELEAGHRRFRSINAHVERELMGGSGPDSVIIPSNPLSLGFTAAGAPPQVPYGLVLGCSDARAPIERIFDTSPNELFVIRVAGNVLGTECLGSIDYAVQNLKESLRLLVVLGHSGCGAVTAAVNSYLSPQDYPGIGLLTRPELAGRSHPDRRPRGGQGARASGPRAHKKEPGYRSRPGGNRRLSQCGAHGLRRAEGDRAPSTDTRSAWSTASSAWTASGFTPCRLARVKRRAADLRLSPLHQPGIYQPRRRDRERRAGQREALTAQRQASA